MGKYDVAGKKVIHLYNQAWVEWLLQDQLIQVDEELSSEFQFMARANDSLLKVTGDEGPFLVLTELQFVYNRTMPDRLAVYKLLAYQKYRLNVFAVVIYFLPPPKDETIKTRFYHEFMGQVNQVDFQAIKLWELDAETVLQYDNPMLIPFVPLMKGGRTEGMVRRCVDRIRQEPVQVAAELESILAIFASYVINVETLRDMLRLEMTVLEDSPIVRELLERKQIVWFEEGKQEGWQGGLEEGIEQGEWRATAKALHQTLAIRFDVDLDQFDEQIGPLNLATLERLNEIALRVQTLSEFETELETLLAQVEKQNDTG